MARRSCSSVIGAGVYLSNIVEGLRAVSAGVWSTEDSKVFCTKGP